jgi:lysozyme family protein
MADFLEAYKITLKHEGGYAKDDDDDQGGETYKGISRRYNPSWVGWSIIDQHKLRPGFPNTAYNDTLLNKEVRKFYKERYWDVNLLDEFNSQPVANEMFDTGVNMGIGRAGRFLQCALNLLNNNGERWDDIVEDGVVGKNTLKALNACLAFRGDEVLYKILNVLQGMHYIEYMTKSPTQEKYAYGWFSRVNFIKE